MVALAGMAATSWTAAVASLLILIADSAVSIEHLALLMLWTGLVSVPVTFHLVRWRRRVHAARQVYLLGEKHKRLFEKMAGETITLR